MTLSHRIQQALYTLIYAGSFILCWWIASLIGFPAERGHGGSLLAARGFFSGLINILFVLVLVPGMSLLVRAVLGKGHWHSVGLTVATAGLSAWSMRGGPIHDLLLYADSASIFLRFGVEVLFLGLVVGATWLMLWNQPHDVQTEQTATIYEIATTLAIATIVFGVVAFVLTQADAKKQCIVSLFIAGVVSASVVQGNWPENGAGRWLFLPPFLVAILGYVFTWIATDNWATGLHEPAGWLSSLACPLPLDYATAGTFGMLIGYWMNIPETEEESNEVPETPVPSGN